MPERSYFETIGPANPLELTFWRHGKTSDPEDSKTITYDTFDQLASFFMQNPLVRGEKTSVPLFSRGRCEGRRRKANVRPPFLVVLDVDGSDVRPELCSAMLAQHLIDHVVYDTWRNSLEPENYYRIVTELTCQTWEELEVVTRCLFRGLGIDPTPESWTSDVFFIPATRTDT